MPSSSLRASLIAVVASVIAVSADPSLAVKISTPNVNVNGLENLKVTATVINTGNETFKLLNDPRGVLNPFPGHSFNITDATGSHPLFNGAVAKYSPAYAASLDDPTVFTVLNPGASIDVTHDLSAAYNFTECGAGNYSIKPSNLFTYVDTDGTPKDLYATIEDVARVNLSGTLAVSRVHDKRASYVGCPTYKQRTINYAASNAQNYAGESYSYLLGMTRSLSGTPRYNTWFGRPYSDDKYTVENIFRSIDSYSFSSFTYDCSTCNDPATAAYVYPSAFGKIYLCGAFWPARTIGTDSRAGTLIHESSHWNIVGGTEDYAYGQADAQRLVFTNQAAAIFNADNYEYFAENTPYLS